MKGYTKHYKPSVYIPNYSNAPYREASDTYYIQDESSFAMYRGVKVEFREVLNEDGSHRSYRLVYNKLFGKDANCENVRDIIDSLFTKLDSLIIVGQSCEYKESETLFDTAIDRVICLKYNRLQKRHIIGDLIKKGLPKSDAVLFIDEL